MSSIPIKTEEEIKEIKKAGKIGALAMKAAVDAVKPGITTLDVDQIAESVILDNNAEPGFKKVAGYDFTTCINVNEGIVHGIPNDYVLKEGDLVSIDLGAYLGGFYSDLAVTVEVGTNKESEFLGIGKKALSAAINACEVGNHLGALSSTIQETVEKAGFTVSRDLVGHGIGRELHEPPQIPCYGSKNSGPILEEGMVFAIEVIYQKGAPTLVLSDDEWTLETKDKSLSGLFEHMVLVTNSTPKILTKC